MKSSRRAYARWWIGTGLSLSVLLVALGCGSGGSNVNDASELARVDTASVAGPIDPSRVTDAETVPRDQYGTSNTVDALIFPSATADERAHFARGLALFSNPALTSAAGQGPYFNETTCLGCHTTQLSGRVPTPASRGAAGHNVFLFGEFTPSTGAFNSLSSLGGPVFHRQHLAGFPD